MRKDEAYLLDIAKEGRKLVDRLAGMALEAFRADEEKQYAAFWAMATMGEAAGKVSAQFRQMHPEVPWRELIAVRNALIHNYANISVRRAWEFITVRTPEIVAAVAPLLQQGLDGEGAEEEARTP